jgi:hypothetical protein
LYNTYANGHGPTGKIDVFAQIKKIFMYLYLLYHIDQYALMLENVDIIVESFQTTLPNIEGAFVVSKASVVKGHEKGLAKYSF